MTHYFGKWHFVADTLLKSDILWLVTDTSLESDILWLTFPQQVTFYDWHSLSKWHFMTDIPLASDILWLTLLQQVTFFDWHSFNKWHFMTDMPLASDILWLTLPQQMTCLYYNIHSFDCSPDAEYVCCGSSDGSIFIWNVNKNKVEKVLEKEHQ